MENNYINRFDKTSKIFAKHQATAKVLGQLPRFSIEAIGFGGDNIYPLSSLIQNDSFANSLPLVALYAFGVIEFYLLYNNLTIHYQICVLLDQHSIIYVRN